MKKRKRTSVIAYCATLSALSTVLLGVGSLISVMDLTCAVLAAMSIVFVVCELGRLSALAVYAVVSLLALVLLPDRSSAIMFAGFFGYYPILKSIFETKLKRRPICIAAKFLSFTAVLAAELYVTVKLFTPELPGSWYIPTLALLAEVTFVIYDIALSRVIAYYFKSLRRRLGINRLFK